jgi:hypothetical protein
MVGALSSPDQARVRIDLDAYCWDCRHRHRLGCTPQDFTTEMWEWEAKHRGHNFEFLSPRRSLPRRFADWMFHRLGYAPWWLECRENANINIAYAATATITCSIASLGSSSTFLAGRESTVINNTSNKYIDYRIGATITVGTSPTADKEIRVYGYAALTDTPTYPDVITGSDAAATIVNTYILNSAFALLGVSSNDATSNNAYFPKCLTVAEAFGHCPTRWGLFIAHNTGVALNATAGNQVLKQTAAYYTSI